MKLETTRVYTELDSGIASGHTTISAQGGARSGKTYNILIWLIVRCVQNPCTTVSVCRATFPALRGSAMRDFLEILKNMGIYDKRSWNKTEFIYTFSNGSWVEFFSCDDEQKLRGRKRAILFVNEANEITYLEWRQLVMRTTTLSILDYNPSFDDGHWIFELNQNEKVYHFITTYKDNPFLPEVIIKAIEDLKYSNSSLWQVYGLGQIAIIEGLVFKNVEIMERFPTDIPRRNVYIGMDLGYNDPTAIVMVGTLGGKLYIDEVCYRTQMTQDDIVSELKPFRLMRIISESASKQLTEGIRREGINLRPVKKTVIMEGIRKMLTYQICVTRHSSNIIKEFRNYTYEQDKNGKWLDKPIDTFNHAIDAVRYVVTMELMKGSRKAIDFKDIATHVYW